MRFADAERQFATLSPACFGHVVSGGMRGEEGAYQPYAHIALLDDALLRAVAEQDAVFRGESQGGEWDRLMFSYPPRHGKSETASKYTPAWYLGSRPERKVGFASYQARFAETWGRKARDLLAEDGDEVFGVGVSDSVAAAGEWELQGHRGGMWTAGIGGGFTGKGFHLLLIDDPVKNAEEAQSEVMREKAWDWWRSTARTRLEKGAIVVLIMTRWHEDDLAGRLLAHDKEVAEDEREGWRVLELPAIAEPDPETGEMYDALGREEGEPLCPELGFDERWAKRTKAAVGTYWWSALYQGRPRPAEGLLYKKADFRYLTLAPATEQYPLGLYLLEDDEGLHPVDVGACVHFQTADTADSEKEMADFTVVSTWAVTPVDRKLLLVNVERAQFERERAGAMLEAAYRSCVPRPVRLTVENAGPSGPKVIKQLLRKGLPVGSANPDTDKVTRALMMVALYEAHRVYHLRGAAWLREWEDEHLAFPNAAHDDQVDTGAYAAIELQRVAAGGYRQKGGTETELGGLVEKSL